MRFTLAFFVGNHFSRFQQKANNNKIKISRKCSVESCDIFGDIVEVRTNRVAVQMKRVSCTELWSDMIRITNARTHVERRTINGDFNDSLRDMNIAHKPRKNVVCRMQPNRYKKVLVRNVRVKQFVFVFRCCAVLGVRLPSDFEWLTGTRSYY